MRLLPVTGFWRPCRGLIRCIEQDAIPLLQHPFSTKSPLHSMSYNRYVPMVIAAGVGVMSGFYIWEPMFKKYQRESKGTWQYEVVQQTRAEELNRAADVAASHSTPSASPSTAPGTLHPELSTTSVEATKPPTPAEAPKAA